MVFGLFRKKKLWQPVLNPEALGSYFSFYENGDYRIGQYEIDQETSLDNVHFDGMYRVDKQPGEGEVLRITPLSGDEVAHLKYEDEKWWILL